MLRLFLSDPRHVSRLLAAKLAQRIARWLFHAAGWFSNQVFVILKLQYTGHTETQEVPDNRLYLLMKHNDGRFEFHGIIAADKEDARKQAWKMRGSLMLLESFEELKVEFLYNASKRQEASELSQRQQATAEGS